MTRVSFVIDGFNLYHSVEEASYNLGLNGAGTKWLNIKQMCTSLLRYIGPAATLENIYYFSAYAHHLKWNNPDAVKRHRTFVRALTDTGVVAEMGRFKRKEMKCKVCKQIYYRYEEKESDVAVAVKMLEICLNNECDIAVVMTGDTDISPAIRTVQRLCATTGQQAWVAFPYNRFNTELSDLVTPIGGTPQTITINENDYLNNQFSDPYIHGKGGKIHKPHAW